MKMLFFQRIKLFVYFTQLFQYIALNQFVKVTFDIKSVKLMLFKNSSILKCKWKITPQVIPKKLLMPYEPIFDQSIKTFNKYENQFQRFFTKVAPIHNLQSSKSESVIFDSKKSQEYEFRCKFGDITAIIEYGTNLLDGKNGVKQDTTKAAKLFKIGSDLGNTECMFLYAFCLFYGEGVKTDFSTAFKLFKETAKRGKIDSEFYLYLCYLEGKGVAQNKDEAYRYLKKSADGGFATSCVTLSLQLPDEDPKKMEYLKVASDQGNSHAQFLYGIHLIDIKKDVKNGIFYLKKSADEGNKYSQYYYGNFLFNGKFVKKDLEMSKHYFLLAADQNDPKACYGYSHALMKDVKVDKQKVFDYMKKAADLGHVDAMIELSEMLSSQYIKIDNKDQNKEALKYIQKAIDNGSSTALMIFALMAEKGDGFDKPNPELADQYFKKAVEETHSAEACKYYSDFLKRQGKEEEMLKYLKMAADLGDADSQFYYGSHLHEQNNYKESERYMRMASENGDTYAMIMVANYNIDNNPNEALNFLKRSIKNGNDHALFILADFLKNKKFPSIKNSEKEAFKYLKMAADKDEEKSVKTVGQWLFYGICCDKNVHESMKYFKKSADLFNDPESQYMYGYISIYGCDGYKVNLKEGIEYYEKAADQNFPLALYALGVLYSDGLGVKKSDTKSAVYFKKSADLGFVNAMNNYALCLIAGIGVRKNVKEAASYFKKAADLGFVESAYNIGILYMSGNGVEKNKELGEKYLKIAKENGFEHALEIGEHVYKQRFDENDSIYHLLNA